MKRCNCMPPPPPPPRPRPDCIPCTDCPPKIYRNPPDVIVKAGKNVTVDTDSGTDVTEYTVNAKFGHVVIDDDSADFIYGDGTEENPLGINDFEGATARKDGKPGVVPAPGIEDKDSFLKGDGTWAPIVIPEQAQSDWAVEDTQSPAFIRNKPGVFTGATGSKKGTEGFVPAPGVGEGDRFLKGDGTWAEIDIPEQVQSDWTNEDEQDPSFIRNKPELATVATTGDYNDLENIPPEIPVFSGATETAAGAKGQVPAPAIAEREMFLKGDGTWSAVDNTRECTAAEMNAWLDEVDNG